MQISGWQILQRGSLLEKKLRPQLLETKYHQQPIDYKKFNTFPPIPLIFSCFTMLSTLVSMQSLLSVSLIKKKKV